MWELGMTLSAALSSLSQRPLWWIQRHASKVALEDEEEEEEKEDWKRRKNEEKNEEEERGEEEKK